jgi:hypothetical protein
MLIESAERFVFDHDVSIAASRVVEVNAASIGKALPLCRLPARLTWIELTPQALPDWIPDVSAFGILMLDGLTHDDKNDHRFLVTCLVTNKHTGEVCAFPYNLRINPDAATDRPEAFIEVLENVFIGDRAIPEGVDLEGLGLVEAQLAVSALAMLNSRNLVSTAPATGLYTRAARRRKERPLLSHSVVKITLSKRDRIAVDLHGISEREVREHLVRGHFKIKKRGVYWWRPHIRGNAIIGRIIHDRYQVSAEAK